MKVITKCSYRIHADMWSRNFGAHCRSPYHSKSFSHGKFLGNLLDMKETFIVGANTNYNVYGRCLKNIARETMRNTPDKKKTQQKCKNRATCRETNKTIILSDRSKEGMS